MAAIPSGDEKMTKQVAPRDQRAYFDLSYLNEDATPDQVITMTNQMIDTINFLSKNLSLKSNFDCQVFENITFTSGETKTLPHLLGVIPRYRIILRQQGNGVISDIPSGWTDKAIQLLNNGSVEVTVTIILLRE